MLTQNEKLATVSVSLFVLIVYDPLIPAGPVSQSGIVGLSSSNRKVASDLKVQVKLQDTGAQVALKVCSIPFQLPTIVLAPREERMNKKTSHIVKFGWIVQAKTSAYFLKKSQQSVLCGGDSCATQCLRFP